MNVVYQGQLSHVRKDDDVELEFRNSISKSSLSPEERTRISKDGPDGLWKYHPTLVDDGELCGMPYSKEKTAWYTYDVANSPFSGLALTMLIPIFLSNMTELVAFNGNVIQDCKDLGIECDKTTWQCYNPGGVPRTLTSVKCSTCREGFGPQQWTGTEFLNMEAKVSVFGMSVDYTSFSAYIIAISVICQALMFISLGPFADYGNGRKKMLTFTSLTGSISCICYIFAYSQTWGYIVAAILLIISNILFGLSIITYNAYLPVLVSAHPKFRSAPHPRTQEERDEFTISYQKEEAAMSSKGFIYGYCAQIFTMGIVLCAFIFVDNDSDSSYLGYRVAIMIVGFWWLIMSIPSIVYLKQRPGEPFPSSATTVMSKIFLGWKSVGRSISMARKYTYTFRFLVLYFLYSDMVSTTTVAGLLFAKRQLCSGTMLLAILLFINMGFSIIGGYFFLWLSNRGFSTKTLACINLGFFCFTNLWGMIGLTNEVIGLQNEWELYFFTSLIGFNIGPLQCYSRTIFADLIPIGEEATMFALYEITDKGSSWLGPIILGAIVQGGANMRYIFVYLVLVSGIPMIALWFFIDHQQGMIDSGRLPPLKDDSTVKARTRDDSTVKAGTVTKC